jgi:CAAX protease family protein
VRTLRLLALVAGALAVTAVLSPWIAGAVTAVFGTDFRFSRVYNRVFEVLLVGGLVLAWRRLDLGGPGDIGLRRRGWAGEFGTGLVAGLAGVGAALGAAWLFGAFVPELRFPLAKVLWKSALGAVGAVAIGVGEEALFRGVLLRRLVADVGRTAGALLVTLVYAAVHAIGKASTHGRGPVDAWAGFERTAALVAPLTSGTALPEMLGLFLLGLVLVTARLRSGSLWVPIGVHAAWVAAFRVGRLFFAMGKEPAWLVGAGWPPLVGGAAGWLGIGITAAVLLGRPTRR